MSFQHLLKLIIHSTKIIHLNNHHLESRLNVRAIPAPQSRTPSVVFATPSAKSVFVSKVLASQELVVRVRVSTVPQELVFILSLAAGVVRLAKIDVLTWQSIRAQYMAGLGNGLVGWVLGATSFNLFAHLGNS